MGRSFLFWLTVVSWALGGTAYRYDPNYEEYNLNTNKSATAPTDYWGEWTGHQFTPSPSNWRFPFYTLFLDRLVNGDPSNDNANGTLYEHDLNSNQLRHGGDLAGLVDTLDYVQGMGIKALYIAGSIFINAPWGYDGYSPLDLSLLDPHFGNLTLWQSVIDEIHSRGMYVVLDSTFATLGDLLGFEGYLNETTPFTVDEHKVQYKSSRQYLDFAPGNNYNQTCQYPRFYNETGYPVDQSVDDQLKGCYDSDFDQYGDTEAFGVFPDWRRQITKFASVQDRLREWHAPVREKLENFYCMAIAQLDIDGFRYDKALQSTVDAMGDMNAAMRTCAAKYGKTNFFLPGEITGGNNMASVYIGRGRQPDQLPNNLTTAITANHNTQQYSIRDQKYAALDGAAFHYTVYRTLTRFLGMDGNLEAGYDAPLNWVDMWNTFLLTNDFTNVNTGQFDPRHMYGVTNQDVFRWPAIKDGVHRQLLGHFITILQMPGVPLLLWGEEQSFYVLDNTAENYIFGRQPLSSSAAWQMHGCYALGSLQYFKFPVDAARRGCLDNTVSYDHRDPSAPVRNILKHMYRLREEFPVLNDGFWLQKLSNQTQNVYYPGNNVTATETGMWSVLRSGIPGYQDFSNSGGQGDTPIWMIYSNSNSSQTYKFDCSDKTPSPATKALLAPFDGGSKVKNLFYPYDELTLENSAQILGVDGSTNPSGCLSTLQMQQYDYRAYVPIDKWIGPDPTITKFIVAGDSTQGHDARILSTTTANGSESVSIELHFSQDMDCDSVSNSISLSSNTVSGRSPTLNKSSAKCGFNFTAQDTQMVGMIPSTWAWSAQLENVENGVHAVTVSNASTSSGATTNANDKFMFRIGQEDNPVVFPWTGNYSTTLLQKDDAGNLFLEHSAAGADLWRYSTNWGSSYNEEGWLPYNGSRSQITEQKWSGTKLQAWKGTHVRVEYFSRMAGSSSIVQQGDIGADKARRFPHLYVNGPYNQYGYDSGLENAMRQSGNGSWIYQFMTEWPAIAQVNVWGINPDGKPDQTYVLGDADGDSILDRLPPSALSSVVLNITQSPPRWTLGWQININDGTMVWQNTPTGSAASQLILFILLWIVPIVSAVAAVWAYMQGFYKIKFNQVGATEKATFIPMAWKNKWHSLVEKDTTTSNSLVHSRVPKIFTSSNKFRQATSKQPQGPDAKRTVLIATMEYDITDWNIKVKIGGLGVMAQLMGKALGHQNLIWVVPCCGGVDYPVDTPADPIKVTILGAEYDIQVQYHQLENITYVLLDAPVFRQQTQKEPYPARMDDLTSAIYYSAWNQCIARTIERFPIDLYHINDYHGCIAPLYLLPKSIPVCLSLHNAEFQGLWPMRTPEESREVCQVYNLPPDVVQKFVQFGEVFNLLHAGASYLRVYQDGFGAVGVSKKYGRRVHLRYPIFWGLKKVGQLPNPDPTDTADWDGHLPTEDSIKVDPAFEALRPQLRVQAQEWAGLKVDPDAELFVFVGRWSMQKGVDLIADVFPSILRKHPKAQLICVGPVIDLYGKFAALKLEKLMEVYPDRVFSRPVFTALPPFIFSGAEFALIPSRDEPFGLVAVEFGRKGALGVGARVGGLGTMPGWWYTVEAVTTQHLLSQFRAAIEEALSCKTSMRAVMRARSAKQRFPVAQWVEDLDILQSTSIRLHGKHVKHANEKSKKSSSRASSKYIANPYDTDVPPIPSPTMPNAMTLGGRLAPPDLAPLGDVSRLRHMQSTDSIAAYMTEDASHQHSAIHSGIQTPNPEEFDSRTLQLDDMPPNFPLGPFDDLPSPGLPKYPRTASAISLLSTDSVVGEKKNYNLQQVDPFFTDSQGTYYTEFTKKLERPDAFEDTDTCIEEYLVKSEKEWFSHFLKAKLGRSEKAQSGHFGLRLPSRPASTRAASTRAPSFSDPHDRAASPLSASSDKDQSSDVPFEEFLLGEDYKPPTGIRKWLQYRIGDWPVYSFLLALGQILAANSYQITLLTGQVGQAAERVYVTSSIYLVASIAFWILFRRVKLMVVLSLPFMLYGLAFFTMAFSRFGATESSRGWIMNVATAFYAIASASGSLYFALNFGDEGGSTVQAWIFRACTIQGSQQLYVAALWFWGSYLNRQTAEGLLASTTYVPITSTWKITAICVPIALVLWAVGVIVFLGLPNYYRQGPGQIPSFYSSIIRRKIILWFFVTVLIQNFFLSTQYGRSWAFLWSSAHLSYWSVAGLVILFFVVIWAALLWGFSLFSHSHSWLLPIFAVGLGAPRWAQMWWGTSGMGSWLPWSGGYVASALLSRSMWLWLGVLDTVQSVGIGMILLSTMTRVHVTFTLTTAQVLGAAMTAIARACAPNNVGPGPVFPNALTSISNLFQGWFWVGLILNLSVCIGFFLFFRKEQLSKP